MASWRRTQAWASGYYYDSEQQLTILVPFLPLLRPEKYDYVHFISVQLQIYRNRVEGLNSGRSTDHGVGHSGLSIWKHQLLCDLWSQAMWKLDSTLIGNSCMDWLSAAVYPRAHAGPSYQSLAGGTGVEDVEPVIVNTGISPLPHTSRNNIREWKQKLQLQELPHLHRD